MAKVQSTERVIEYAVDINEEPSPCRVVVNFL